MRPLIRKYLFPLLQAIVRPFFAVPFLRSFVNALILPLPLYAQFMLHKVFGRTFRGRSTEPAPGVWKVRFAGKIIKMPLRKGFFWLDWETALSIIGHEHFIKAFYAALLESSNRPEVFLDVGANFGTHSLLFMAHGIPAISFEPNKTCEPYFREACALNGFTPQWNAIAVGAQAGEIELTYPEKETWNGTIIKARESELESQGKLIHDTVPLRPLDSYLEGLDGKQVFIKIDTEGAELEVLRGVQTVLTRIKPLMIFESMPGETRIPLYDLLAGFGYTLTDASWRPGTAASPLTREQYVNSMENDFIALPRTP